MRSVQGDYARGYPSIVGFGGSTRPNSASEMALRVALSAAQRQGARTEGFFGEDLQFPMFKAQESVYEEKVARFIAALRDADGVIIASPGYHGSISGLLKNAIDYIELLRDNERPYFEGRAVGCIVCAAGWQATGTTLMSLRSIVHALRGWPTPLGAMVNTAVVQFGSDATCMDALVGQQLTAVAGQVCEFAARLAQFPKQSVVDESMKSQLR